MRQPFWKDGLAIEYTLTIGVTCPTPRHLPKRNKMYGNTKTCAIWTAIFAIAPNWKQAKCPLTNEWIHKVWEDHSTDYYSVVKRNQL